MVRLALRCLGFFLLTLPAWAQTWPAPTITYSGDSSYTGPSKETAGAHACTPYGGTFAGFQPHNVPPDLQISAICDGEPPFGQFTKPVAVYYTCASGWQLTADKTECRNSVCVSAAGFVAAFNVNIHDDGGCNNKPTHVCLSNGCRAVVESTSDCLGLPLGIPPSSYWTGFAKTEEGQPCGETDGSAKSPSNDTNTGVSGGGGGVISVPGDGSAPRLDTENLARIATNTKRTADALTGGASGGGGTGTGGVTPSDLCGGEGQQPCQIDEGNTGQAGETAGAAQDGDKSAMQQAMNDQIEAVDPSKLPDFDTKAPSQSSRWWFGFDGLIATAGDFDCKLKWQSVLGGSSVSAGYDFCSFADIVRSVLYWVFGVFTALALWNMLYRG